MHQLWCQKGRLTKDLTGSTRAGKALSLFSLSFSFFGLLDWKQSHSGRYERRRRVKEEERRAKSHRELKGRFEDEMQEEGKNASSVGT